MHKSLHRCLWFLVILISCNLHSQDSYWRKSELGKNTSLIKLKNINPSKYQIHSLHFEAFNSLLKSAPKRSDISKSSVTVSLPTHDGKFELFKVVEAPILSQELSLKYPNIKTYLGFSESQPGVRVRFSVTPQGLQTMMSFPDKPTLFTVPVAKGNTSDYITYDRGVRVNGKKEFECLTEAEIVPIDEGLFTNKDANDQTLRTFRIAISTNGEYTNHWDDGNAANGDAQEDALAQVVATLNRSNEVFEVDMAINFTLVTGTEIIYPNPSTDPYTGAYNSQLQNTLTSVIGESNYDIGHLFAKDSKGGSAGCIGCVCVNNSKGSGYSAHDFLDNDGGPYMADFFDIDYVPHEIGHQLGAYHTFSFRNEGIGVNVEPGSGTTIMGYAGITGSNDVQDHSDPYFNYHSIRQILNNMSTRRCWAPTPISNNPPVANAGANYTIPGGTAFLLEGNATDPDNGDVLTYTWEQIDDGTTTSSNFGPTKATGAIFRSRPPSTNSTRYFPLMSRILASELTETNPLESVDNTTWETVSTVSRDINFALTVRDRAEANGVGQFPQTSFDNMTVTVDGTSGPFAITSQNSDELWNVGSSQTVTWDVAGTASGDVNSPTVDILLSSDGGQNFSVVAASNVPNDGSHTFSVPQMGGDSNQMRVMVRGHNNIFFAVNSSNFSYQESEFAMSLDNVNVDVCSPNNAVFTFTYNTFLGFNGTTNFSTTGLPTGVNAAFNPTSASADGTQVTLSLSNIGNASQGAYNFDIVGTSGAIVKTSGATLGVFESSISQPILASPNNSETGVVLLPTLEWNSDTNASSYQVQLATDNGFSNLLVDETLSQNSFTLNSQLQNDVTYFWRVKAFNACGESAFSEVRSFTTTSCSVCASEGDMNFETSTTRVIFNTIDNESDTDGIKVAPYTDYTSISTNVKREEDYDLTVHVNTDGNFTVHTIVWIDWNQDCDFDDANETYDLGTARDVLNEATSLSPLTVTVPASALLGGTIMRVATEWNRDPTSCAVDYDGEVEDYVVVVEEATASLEDFAFEGFNLYPNPANDNFTIRLNTISNEAVFVKMMDLSGRTIFQKEYNNPGTRFAENIALNRVASGVYLVQIRNGNKQTTRKLIIE